MALCGCGCGLCGCGRGSVSSLVNVDVYCGSDEISVNGLLDKLEESSRAGAIGEVEFFPLSYNVKEMNATEFRKKHFMLLCHSINNRRFSITDVTDSLYDDYLKNAKRKLKQKRVGVIAHDFPANVIIGENLQNQMDAFRSKQPSTFKYSCFATVAANLNTQPVGLSDGQLDELVERIQISSLSSKEREKHRQRQHQLHEAPRQAPVEQPKGNDAPDMNTPGEVQPK